MIRRFIYIIFIVCIFSRRVTAANYYWVGGSGDWNQLGHWATTSGGTTFHTQIPTPGDNVFFDAASFTATGQVVGINIPRAVCNSMDWTGVTNNPTFRVNFGSILETHGSLKLVAGMIFDFNGHVSFEATTTGNTITSAGHTFGVFGLYEFVEFKGDGDWTLLDSLKSGGTIRLTHGTLHTNNQLVVAYRFASEPEAGSSRTLNMASSIFSIYLEWNVSGVGLTINAGTSTINITSSDYYSAFSGGNHVYHNLHFAGSTITNSSIMDNNTFNDVSFDSRGMVCGNNIFHNLSLSRGGLFLGSNTCNDLSLAAGYTYILASGTTQTIDGSLLANGTCSAPITIVSNTTNNQASISRLPGNVTLEFAALKDINAIGGATFTANNSIDLGNNTGWIINALTSRNFYWVGNGGNFNDPGHWSLTSGGPPAFCIPTPVDNVFFDPNSFSLPSQIVSTNGNAYCHNMSWVGALHNPEFRCFASDLLRLYGSLEFIPVMTTRIDGPVYFEAVTTDKIIISSGKIFTTVAFNGIGGGWTLQDALTVTSLSYSEISLNNGSLNTNNHTVTAHVFNSATTNPRSLITGSSVFNLSNSNQCWFVMGTGMTMDAGTSTINSTNPDGANFSGGSLVYHNLNFAGRGSIDGNNVFNDVNFGGNGTIYSSNTFNNAKFYKDGTIRNHNTYNNLSFTEGYNYVLTNGAIQTINNLFTASGTCSSRITISTNIPGNQSSISHPQGAVTVNYVTLKDLNATGGALFTANNVVDLGNNTGWILNPVISRDLYWIGGTGNWNDGNHWSFTSGGPPAGCTPTALDNVFFDINSFPSPGQIVTINVPVAYCKSMTWTGAINYPTFAGPDFNTLKIYGSLTFIPGMIQDFRGSVYFEATTPGRTITSASQSFRSDITFNGVGGDWTLTDSFSTTGPINFNNGTLNTNNQTVNASSLFSYTGTTRVLNMGSSVFNMSGLNIWDVISTNMTINAGTSTIRAINSGNAGPGLFRSNTGLTYYNVEFNNPYVPSTTIAGGSIFNNVFFIGAGIIQNSNTFNRVTFSKSARVEDSNTFSTLACTPTYTYTFGSGKTQVLQTDWEITGKCDSTIFLESSVAGNPAFVNKTAGTINAYYNQISDIHCTGGAIFNAYNSANVGGNSGWNFLILPTLSTPDTVHGLVSICPGQTGIIYYVTPVQGAVSYSWTVPAGATIISEQGDTLIVVDFGTAVSGNVVVTASNNCFAYTTKTLAITISNPIANSGPDASVCTGNSYTVPSAQATGYTLLNWTTTGAGVFINNGTLAPTYVPNAADIAAGTIALILTATGNPSCPAISDTTMLTIIPASVPLVNITADPATTICAGTSINFTAFPVNGGSLPVYQWRNNGNNVGTNSPFYSSSTLLNGDIISCGITSNQPCAGPVTSESNSITMTVNNLPQVFIGNDSALCEGASIILDAGQGYSAYLWNNGTSLSTLIADTIGSYWVRVTTNNGCIASDTMRIMKINPNPKDFLQADIGICKDSLVIIGPLSSFRSYMWSSNQITPTITITQPGLYQLQVWDNNGCTGLESIRIYPVECQKGFFIPSAFTPNDDRLNDLFKPLVYGTVKQYSFAVYNRWGQMVFYTTNPAFGWDGNFNGIRQSSNVFVWFCHYQLEGEAVRMKKGSVVLIR